LGLLFDGSSLLSLILGNSVLLLLDLLGLSSFISSFFLDFLVLGKNLLLLISLLLGKVLGI